MKKIIICIFVVLFSVSSFADENIIVPTDVMVAWGNPKTTSADNDDQIKEAAKDVKDNNGKTRLVYMARKIVPHGGYFCLTVLDSVKYSNSVPGRYTSYHQPTGEICGWYCENGYSGENCVSGTGENCNLHSISELDLLADKITLTSADIKNQLKKDNGIFVYGYTDLWNYERNVILAAEKFLTNGHGITAKSVTFKAGNYDYEVGNGTTAATSAEIKGSTSNITKTLCAEGWSGNDCGTRTTACTACPDNRVFITAINSCSEDTLDPDHPGDKGYSCNGDRKKWMNNSTGKCQLKGSISSENMAKFCWKEKTPNKLWECLTQH